MCIYSFSNKNCFFDMKSAINQEKLWDFYAKNNLSSNSITCLEIFNKANISRVLLVI